MSIPEKCKTCKVRHNANKRALLYAIYECPKCKQRRHPVVIEPVSVFPTLKPLYRKLRFTCGHEVDFDNMTYNALTGQIISIDFK